MMVENVTSTRKIKIHGLSSGTRPVESAARDCRPRMPAERLSTMNVAEYGLRLRLLEEYCLVEQVFFVCSADAGGGQATRYLSRQLPGLTARPCGFVPGRWCPSQQQTRAGSSWATYWSRLTRVRYQPAMPIMCAMRSRVKSQRVLPVQFNVSACLVQSQCPMPAGRAGPGVYRAEHQGTGGLDLPGA